MAKVAWLLAAVVLVGVAVGQAAHLSASGKVTLQVFYEALCKDSIRFVKDQLKPTYEAVGSERMVVDFVPYGRARTTPSATGYTFECEHGPNECRGNELQACGLARLTDNMKQVKFVYCVETQTDPSRPDNTCITEAGLDPNDINGCTDGTEGQKLLAQLGYKTPTLTYTPTIVFNGEYNKKDQDLGEKNLLSVVCDKLGSENSPAACKSSSSSSTSLRSAMLVSLSSIILTAFIR